MDTTYVDADDPNIDSESESPNNMSVFRDHLTTTLVLKRSLMPKNKLAIIHMKGDKTQYCCVQCPSKYMEKEKLEVHLLAHYKEYRFLCGICGTGLKRKEHLERHTLGHQEVRPHVCPECGKAFKRKEHMNIHRSIHSGDKNQVCSLCEKTFYRKDHLQKHLQTHNKMFTEQNIIPLNDEELMEFKQEAFDEDVKPVINQEFGCEVTMEIEEEQNEPSPDQSVDPLRPYSCPICFKTYKRRDHLKLHSLTHVERDKICTECGKGFHWEEQLLAHMSAHLNNSYPNGEEIVPDVEYADTADNYILPLDNDPASLLVPRAMKVPRSKQTAESRPHECPICQRRFKRKQHLKVHANVHTKLMLPSAPIWCCMCNEGFQTNAQFESHQCLNQSSNGEIEVAPQDAKKENYPTATVEDASSSLEELHIPTPQKVFVCKYCTKPFRRKDHYKIHLHIHTGVKSFFCPDCGKGFYRKDHLQKHSQVHQKNRPKPRKVPDLFPIHMVPKKEVKPEITITAPSNTKLRVPLQIKVPYQVVMSMDNGEQRAVTIDPQVKLASKPTT